MRTLVATALIMALVASLPAARAQTGTAPFCLKRATGQVICTFGTMGECEQARPGTSADQCITRSDAGGTTGLSDTPRTSLGNPTDRSLAPER